MKFNLYSDIHMEWFPLELPGGENLLLSGDITVADFLRPERTDKNGRVLLDRAKQFFFEECAKYKNVYYIMGNHEHYHGVFDNSAKILREFLKGSNVNFMDKEWVLLNDDTILWAGTLWTNMYYSDPNIMWDVKRGMNDYIIIQKERTLKGTKQYFTLTPEDTVEEYNLALKSLKDCLEAHPDKKFLVMTHMAPSSKSSHPRYGIGNPLNWAYYSNLDDFILDHQNIKVWVHGHTHDSHSYMIGDTRVMCNPRGYTQTKGSQENVDFDINFNFEV